MGPWKNATPSAPVRGLVGRAATTSLLISIEGRPGVDHADLAVRLGWYDQAHFINDFRTMLGSTPREYASQYAG